MFKLELKRYLKNPINLLFSIGLPVGLLLLSGLTNQEYLTNSTYYVAIILLNSLSLTIVPISSLIYSDKHSQRIKHYLLIDNVFNKFLLNIYLTNLIIYEITLGFLTLVATVAFKSYIDVNIGIMLIFLPILAYTIGFMMAIIISSWSKKATICTSLAMIMLFSMMMLGGLAMPFHYTHQDAFFYIEMFSFWGQLLMMFNHVSNTAPFLMLSTTQLALTASVFVIGTLILSIGFWFSVKNFKK